MSRTKAQESLFGENFKYVLVLTVLAWMVYTLPSVREALADVSVNFQTDSLAAVSTAQAPRAPGFFMGANEGNRPLPPNASSSLQRGMPMGAPGRGPEMSQRKELTPQQVVTLLFTMGFISQDKLNDARVAVDHYGAGTSTPPIPCAATSTIAFHASSTLPFPCREIGKDHMPPRPATTTDLRMMRAQDDRR